MVNIIKIEMDLSQLQLQLLLQQHMGECEHLLKYSRIKDPLKKKPFPTLLPCCLKSMLEPTEYDISMISKCETLESFYVPTEKVTCWMFDQITRKRGFNYCQNSSTYCFFKDLFCGKKTPKETKTKHSEDKVEEKTQVRIDRPPNLDFSVLRLEDDIFVLELMKMVFLKKRSHQHNKHW